MQWIGKGQQKEVHSRKKGERIGRNSSTQCTKEIKSSL
jgi:hypothetical protein